MTYLIAMDKLTKYIVTSAVVSMNQETQNVEEDTEVSEIGGEDNSINQNADFRIESTDSKKI